MCDRPPGTTCHALDVLGVHKCDKSLLDPPFTPLFLIPHSPSLSPSSFSHPLALLRTPHPPLGPVPAQNTSTALPAPETPPAMKTVEGQALATLLLRPTETCQFISLLVSIPLRSCSCFFSLRLHLLAGHPMILAMKRPYIILNSVHCLYRDLVFLCLALALLLCPGSVYSRERETRTKDPRHHRQHPSWSRGVMVRSHRI